jgi:large subunit ribosomal protein L29
MKNETKELREKTVQELADRVNTLRQELFGLRLQSKTGHVKDLSQFNKLRRGIARTITIIKQKESGVSK